MILTWREIDKQLLRVTFAYYITIILITPQLQNVGMSGYFLAGDTEGPSGGEDSFVAISTVVSFAPFFSLILVWLILNVRFWLDGM